MDSYSRTGRYARQAQRPAPALVRAAGRALRAATVAGAVFVLGGAIAAAANAPIAAANAPASASARGAAARRELAAQVLERLRTRMPLGVRIDAVNLGCEPPPNARLKSVAPGVSVLSSRGFVVELGENGRTFVCSAWVDAKRPVLAASRDIAPNQSLSQADFTTTWVDAFSGAPGAFASFPDQGPYVAATDIRAGQPLYPSELARPLAVHPGDMVTVLVRNGPVLVRTRLEARQAASIGQTATMVNPSSGAVVSATVTGVRAAEMVLQ